MEPVLHPSVARYLALLPEGLASFPEAQAKGAILREVIDDRLYRIEPASLPRELAALYRDPPTVSQWCPEVHFNALVLAVHDQYFAGADGEAAFDRWAYDRNRRMLDKPLYRILFSVASPSHLLHGVKRRWSAFRRGTELRVDSLDGTEGWLSLTHPPHLVTDLEARGLAGALRAALELSGGRNVTTRLVKESPVLTRVQVRFVESGGAGR